MSEPLLASLTDTLLTNEFGTATLQRARPYALGRAIGSVEITRSDAAELVAEASVSGTGPVSYRTHLTVRKYAARATAQSRCSCPVGHQCKHGAALALVLRAQHSGSTRWEEQLAGLLSEADAAGGSDRGASTGPTQGLALQFHLTLPGTTAGRRQSLAPGIRMRPMREGARRRWIKTGASWPDLRAATAMRDADPDQLDVLRHLFTSLTGGRSYWNAVERPYLEDFGPGVWRDLVRAREAGVHFELARPLAALEVLDEPVDLSIDLARGSAFVELRPGIAQGERFWTGDDVLTIGAPAHGVALLEEVPNRATKGPAPRRIILAPLRRPASAETARLLRRPEGVIVPTDGWQRFETEHLPRLRRGFAVGSRDGSVALAAAPVPRLVLDVSWSVPVQAELRWQWHYGTGEATRAWPLDSVDGLGGVRDPHAERRLLARLVGEHDLTGIDLRERGPRAHQTVSGADVLDLTEKVLPSLVSGDVVAVVENTRPELREAVGDPEISFEATGQDPSTASTDWLDLRVVLTVDGEQVPLADVVSALTLGLPRIMLPSGLHLSSDRPELQALRDLVASAAELREGERDGISVGVHDLGVWAQLADLGIVDAQAATFVARAQALRDLTTLPTPDPVGVVSTMRGYQLDGFHWLSFLHAQGLGGVLADDMGLGKTLQVLATISHARAGGSGRFLVVAPTSVVSAWESEARRHTPGLKVVAVTASAARRVDTLAEIVRDADVVVTTYTLLRLESDAYASLEWGGLVLDEAQQVKNHQSKTYQAVRRVDAPFRLAVTGTPFENRLMELWSLLSITVPGLYPWPTDFERLVAKPVEKDGDEAVLRRFRQRIRPFLLRRTKELVAADLPPKQEQVLEVQLGPQHRRVYDTHLQRERQKILGLVDDFGRNRVAIFSSLTRLRQLALDAGLVDDEHDQLGSAKIDLLVEHLEEVVEGGHRALVFSQFTSFLTRVRDRLDAEGIATAYLDGSTRRRGEVVEGFKGGDAPVFLISLKAGGVGLTLTEADYVFVLDPWWNPATEAQAVDRAHRIGQQRPVMVYRLVSTDTIEEKVMELKARKAELFAQVVDGDGALSAAISAEDIRGLFED